VALRVDHLRAQRDLALGAVQRVLQRDLDRGMVILAAAAGRRAGAAAAAPLSSMTPSTSPTFTSAPSA
jgi:hypothetical protein